MNRRGWVLFLAMGVIWGVPYLLIKVAVEELEPSFLVLARTLLAGLLLLPLALARGHLRGLTKAWAPILAFTVVEVCIPWLLLAVAEQRLSSSLTGLLIAAVPLVGAVLAWGGADRLVGRPDDRPDAVRAVGLLVGFAGVGALVGFEVGSGDAAAVAAVAVVAVCYAVGPLILARWLSDLPGLGVITASMLVSAALYLPAGLAQAPAGWPAAEVVWSVLGLAVVCTALAFVVFFALIAEVGPTRSTVITYLNPAVALVLGVLVLDEAFTAATATGFALILAGSVLATRRARPSRAPEPALVTPRRHREAIDAGCDELSSAAVPEP